MMAGHQKGTAMPITKWAGIAVALAATGVCAAQSYPNKPVRVIFAFAAGGAGDKRDIARWKKVAAEAGIRL